MGVLGQALGIAPNDPHVLQGIGVCLSKQSRWPEAIAAFDAALAASPGFAASLHHKGAVLEIMGVFYRRRSRFAGNLLPA